LPEGTKPAKRKGGFDLSEGFREHVKILEHPHPTGKKGLGPLVDSESDKTTAQKKKGTVPRIESRGNDQEKVKTSGVRTRGRALAAMMTGTGGEDGQMSRLDVGRENAGGQGWKEKTLK